MLHNCSNKNWFRQVARQGQLLAPLLMLTLAGCFEAGVSTPDATSADGVVAKTATEPPKINLVATTNIVADLATNLGGDYVNVTSLMGPGVDPHLYKASEGDVARLLGADIVFYTGLHLEGKIVDLLDNLNRQGKTAVAVAEAIPADLLLGYPGDGNLHDPHVWMDATLWDLCARRLSEALQAHDPGRAEQYQQLQRRYSASLSEAHNYALARVAELKPARRIMVTAHDAFSYFGRAYGFEVRGLLGVSTAAEAGTADVDKLANFIVARQVPAIFVESTISDRYLKALQEAVAAKNGQVEIGGSLYADALGEKGGDAGTYLGMFKTNIDTIVDALSKS